MVKIHFLQKVLKNGLVSEKISLFFSILGGEGVYFLCTKNVRLEIDIKSIFDLGGYFTFVGGGDETKISGTNFQIFVKAGFCSKSLYL